MPSASLNEQLSGASGSRASANRASTHH